MCRYSSKGSAAGLHSVFGGASSFFAAGVALSAIVFLVLSLAPPGRAAAFGRAAAGKADSDTDREARKARGKLVSAVRRGDKSGVSEALGVLVRAGGKKNISFLLKLAVQVPDSEDSIYWALIEGACSFTDREALEELGEAIVRNARNGLSRDIFYGLSGNRSRNVVAALAPVVQKGPRDLKVLAIEKLGGVYTPEAVDILIDLLKKEEKKSSRPEKSKMVLEIVHSLQRITRQKIGPSGVNWEGWWSRNRNAKLGPGKKRHGRERPSTGTVIDRLDRERREQVFGLEKAPKKGVVVLSAVYEKPVERDLNNDHIEGVLQRMGIPHEVVYRPEFDKYDLSQTGALIINCAQFHRFCICPKCKPGGKPKNRLYRCTGCNEHRPFSAKLSGAAIQKIRRFVKRGGYLFGEDWIVKEVLERAFPKHVAAGAVLRESEMKSVDVVPARGRSTHPYLEGIFYRVDSDPFSDDDDDDFGRGGTGVGGGESDDDEPELVELKHRWSIDDESWAFDILGPSKVLILMTSGELQENTEGQGVVAFAFRPGGSPRDIGMPSRGRSRPGVVLQVLSHFGRQASTRDEFLLQNILLNFLIDANVEREMRQGPAAKKKRRS